MTLEDAIREAAASGLSELDINESMGGWQAIAKFHGALTGPWCVGVDPDPAEAIRKALAKRAAQTTDKDIFS